MGVKAAGLKLFLPAAFPGAEIHAASRGVMRRHPCKMESFFQEKRTKDTNLGMRASGSAAPHLSRSRHLLPRAKRRLRCATGASLGRDDLLSHSSVRCSAAPHLSRSRHLLPGEKRLLLAARRGVLGVVTHSALRIPGGLRRAVAQANSLKRRNRPPMLIVRQSNLGPVVS